MKLNSTLTVFRLICFSALLLSAFPCKAQLSQFEKTWNPGNQRYGRGVDVVTTDDGYTVLFAYDTGTAIGTIPIYSLVHMDMNGIPVWSKNYCRALPCTVPWGGLDESHGTLLATHDGGYLINVIVNDTATSTVDVALIKTDGAGNVQWSQRYGDVGVDVPVGVIETYDGGYLLAVSAPHPPIWAYDLLIFKLDYSGNIQWNYHYAAGHYGCIWHDVIECGAGNGYFITGNDISIRIDANGTVLWSKDYGCAFWKAFWTGSSFLIAGTGSTGQFVFSKLDANGNYIWQKWYTQSSCPDLQPRDAIRTNNGDIVVGGFGDHTTVPYTGYAELMRMDSMGNVQWYHSYTVSGWMRVRGLARDHTGSYVFTGSTVTPAAPSDELVYFVRTDQQGNSFCNDAGCTAGSSMLLPGANPYFITRTVSGFSLPWPVYISSYNLVQTDLCNNVGIEEESAANGLAVYPNPANGSFKVSRIDVTEASDVVITDISGKTVARYSDAFRSGQSEFQIDLDLAPGVYFVSLYTDEKQIVEKLIVK